MPDLKLPLKIEYAEKAERQIKKLDIRQAKELIEGLKGFAQTLRPSPKPLTGSLKGLYRLRFGDRRAIVKIADGVVYVLEIGARDKIYKRQ